MKLFQIFTELIKIVSSAFWSANYICLNPGCNVKFNAKIQQRPSKRENVTILIKVDGTATHAKHFSHRISGLKRTMLGYELGSKGTLNLETENSLHNLLNSDENGKETIFKKTKNNYRLFKFYFYHLYFHYNW